MQQQKNHGFVNVVGEQFLKYKEIYVVQFNTGEGTPCKVSNIITYNNNNSFVSYRSFTFCECNESVCEGETIKGITDSLITIERRVWTGYSEDEEGKTPNDTFIINYLYINKNGYLKELDRKQDFSSDFIIFDKILGDLDNDGIVDSVFITKGTNIQNVIKDEYRGVLDRNNNKTI